MNKLLESEGFIKNLAKKQHLSVEKVEKFWKKAKEIASEKFNKTDKPYWPFVNYLTKRLSGITESSQRNFKSYFILEQAIDDTLKEVGNEFHLDASIEVVDNILNVNQGKFISNISRIGFVIKNIIQQKDNELLLQLETSFPAHLEPVIEAIVKEIKQTGIDEKSVDFSKIISLEPIKDDQTTTQYTLKTNKNYKFIVVCTLRNTVKI
jgi:hypothetical protein